MKKTILHGLFILVLFYSTYIFAEQVSFASAQGADTSAEQLSLSRKLGLKIKTIYIDPAYGGKDMTTHTKIAICSYTATIMMLLIVFSKPLNIPELFHHVLIVGVFIPLALMFYFIKAQKKEQTEESIPATQLSASSIELDQKKKKNQITLMIVVGTAVGLSCPLWLPLTGSSLGAQGDFIVGLITAVIVLAILGPRLRKLQRN